MRTLRSKKKESEKGREMRSNFDGVVPVDLVIEITRRLPVKSIARFVLVSKLWASIIRSREFITSFSFRSSSEPCLLVAFVDSDRSKHQNWYFFSLTPCPSSTSWLSASLLSCVTCPFLVDEGTSHYVNGLVSLAYGQKKQVIANPSTGKVLSLPRVKNTTSSKFTVRFFGYDLVNDQYKVLCMTSGEGPSSQHQVFTLGAKKKTWRMIDCSVPHSPWSTSVCIDGVLYYVAKTGTNLSQRSLMRFDLRSEKLDLFTSLSSDIEALNLKGYDLINYQGKVAILISTQTRAYTPILAAWVMDQNAEKHVWLKKITFSIERFMSSYQLRITGTTHTGEFILAPSSYVDGFYVILYNPHTKKFKIT